MNLLSIAAGLLVLTAGASSALSEETRELDSPAPGDPAKTKEEPQASAPLSTGIPVAFTSRQPNLTLHIKAAGSADPFASLCMSPCERMLPPGPYEFSIGSQTRPAVPVPGQWELSAPGATLEGRYHDRRGMRIAGVVLLATLVSCGVAATAVGIAWDPGDDGIIPFAAGLGGIALGLGLGIPFVLRKPSASIIYGIK